MNAPMPTVFMETYGCQMNVLDSELVMEQLGALGYSRVNEPKDAGVVFEGDRRFPIVVRLNDKVREDREALENIPVPLPPGLNGRASSVLLKQVASFSVTESASARVTAPRSPPQIIRRRVKGLKSCRLFSRATGRYTLTVLANSTTGMAIRPSSRL